MQDKHVCKQLRLKNLFWSPSCVRWLRLCRLQISTVCSINMSILNLYLSEALSMYIFLICIVLETKYIDTYRFVQESNAASLQSIAFQIQYILCFYVCLLFRMYFCVYLVEEKGEYGRERGFVGVYPNNKGIVYIFIYTFKICANSHNYFIYINTSKIDRKRKNI